MRTTVTLDPDVEVLLKKAMRDSDRSFKQALNDSLRLALLGAARKAPVPYRQPTFNMGSPLVELTKANSLAAELEDQELIARMANGR